MSLPSNIDVPDVDADAKINATVDRQVRVALGHRALHCDHARHRVDDARELEQQAIAHGLDYATAVLANRWIDQLRAVSPQGGQCAGLVRAHQPHIAGNIGRDDGGKFAGDPALVHRLPPDPRWIAVG